MQLATIQAQNSRIGTCPHGLPMGACPICNGMMGGGAAKKADFSAKPGEMSYAECAAIGAFLRAQKAAQKAREMDYQMHVQNLAKFQANIQKMADKVAQFNQMVQNSMPAIIAKPINFVMNNVVLKALDMIKNFPNTFANFVQNISQKIADISDKLAAVYGEVKTALAKKSSEIFSNIKKKVKSLFGIFEPSDADNDDKKVNEAKKTFELKTFIHKLYKKLRDKDED